MAYQPKSYRKFLATSVAAAVVATAAGPIAGVSAAETKFNDIAGVQSWAGDAIEYLVEKGAIQGYPDGTFKPTNSLTRAQAAKVLAISLELDIDTTAKTNFADAKNHWASSYIAAIQDQAPGVIDGFPNGTFQPDATITREQLAKIVVEAYGLEENENAVINFNDVSGWAADYVNTLASLGVVEGVSANKFNPKGNVNRAQAAVFVYRTEVEEARVDVELDLSANVVAINNTTVEVHFEDALNSVNAADFEIDGLDVENAATKQNNSNVVVLTTSEQEGGEVYTVSYQGENIGSFEGISAIIPESVEIEDTSIQGIIGQEVTLTADIGQKAAGVPVTFNIDAENNSLNKDIVEEVLTDENGIATFSYTQYNAGYSDQVFVYPTGAPAKRDYATVHWGIDTILALEEDDNKSNELNNGSNKVYKITYKSPKTGKPVSDQEIHLTFLENIDVEINKITHATVNGKTPYQLANGKKEFVTVKTDSKGQATVTVTGTNTKASLVAFIDDSGNIGENNDKLDQSELYVTAEEVTFGAIHLKYEIEVERDGGEEAAIGSSNGRKYKVVVKDENGKAAAGERINVAFDEDLDRVISTNTKAEFVIDNADLKGTTNYYNSANKNQIEILLDSKGEGEFKIVSSDNKDYATPVVWIDINTSSNKHGVLEQDEPKNTAAMTYFADEKIAGSQLKVYNFDTNQEIKDNRTQEGDQTVEFRFNVANQSGKAFGYGVSEFTATYQVTNTGTKDVYVWTDVNKVGDISAAKVISTRRGETFTLPRTTSKQVSLYLASNGETATVDVVAYGEARGTGSDDKLITLSQSKVAKASFKSGADLGTSHRGTITKFDSDKKKLTFSGKKELDYKPEYDDNKVRYFDQTNGYNVEIAATQFEDLMNANKGTNTVQYFKNSSGEITFTIISLTNAPAPVDPVDPKDPVDGDVEITAEIVTEDLGLGSIIFYEITGTVAGDAEVDSVQIELGFDGEEGTVVLKGVTFDPETNTFTFENGQSVADTVIIKVIGKDGSVLAEKTLDVPAV